MDIEIGSEASVLSRGDFEHRRVTAGVDHAPCQVPSVIEGEDQGEMTDRLGGGLVRVHGEAAG